MSESTNSQTIQPVLISGYFRCANCGKDVERTQKTRRFRLCDACWAAIMPDWEQASVKGRDPGWYADTNEQHKQIEAYWGWYYEMEKRYPSSRGNRAAHYLSFRHQPVTRSSDDYYPFCECGSMRETLGYGKPGLYGGPFMTYCSRCKAKEEVESFVKLSKAIHPDWDAEDWLDALYKIMPNAFAIGVLPDYWFEIMRSAL